MGFRDLRAFNLAMLAKQCWRLITHPETLCTQVLRAKYYPDGNLLNAGPKKGSSFTWQSIVSGLQTFKRGHIWRVGTGTQINIWNDHWMLESHSRKIVTPRGNTLLTTVDELINPGTGWWDEALIRSIFSPLDVESILRIPLSDQLPEDFVAWNATKLYCFSVRSAYYIEWEHQFGPRLRRAPTETSSINPVWDILWKLQIPSKIKKIVWRALHEIIPGVGVLRSRHIKVSPSCPICHDGPEYIRHLIFICKRAKEVWKSLGLDEIIDQALCTDRSGSVVLEEILRLPLQKSPVLGQLGLQETIAVGGWYIWWERREAVKGNRVKLPPSSAFAIQAITANHAVHATVHASELRWQKPAPGNYKLNIDAAFFEGGVGAAAAVLRNYRGEAIAGASNQIDHILDAPTAEAMALRRGLMLLHEVGCSRVTVESDCLELWKHAMEILKFGVPMQRC